MISGLPVLWDVLRGAKEWGGKLRGGGGGRRGEWRGGEAGGWGGGRERHEQTMVVSREGGCGMIVAFLWVCGLGMLVWHFCGGVG